MANLTYNSIKYALATNAVNLATSTFKFMLVTSSYTPDIDTHQFRSDVTNEVVGGGYSAGGVTLTGVAISSDLVNNLTKWTADNPSWASATITARGGVIYLNSGLVSTDRLVSYIDFGSNASSTNATFLVQWGANGFLTLA